MKNLYFTARNGELYTKFTKEEIYSTIDPYNWVTVLNWLEEMDYPPLSSEYFRKVQNCEEQGQDVKYAFGKFLAMLRLAAFKDYCYKDGDFLIRAWDKSTIKWGI